MREKNEFVSVIICTHGVPTDRNGKYDKEVLKEFVDNLKELAELPVRIIFRLITDDEKVLDYYSSLDKKIVCDVLDDYLGEVRMPYLLYDFPSKCISYFCSTVCIQ